MWRPMLLAFVMFVNGVPEAASQGLEPPTKVLVPVKPPGLGTCRPLSAVSVRFRTVVAPRGHVYRRRLVKVQHVGQLSGVPLTATSLPACAAAAEQAGLNTFAFDNTCTGYVQSISSSYSCDVDAAEGVVMFTADKLFSPSIFSEPCITNLTVTAFNGSGIFVSWESENATSRTFVIEVEGDPSGIEIHGANQAFLPFRTAECTPYTLKETGASNSSCGILQGNIPAKKPNFDSFTISARQLAETSEVSWESLSRIDPCGLITYFNAHNYAYIGSDYSQYKDYRMPTADLHYVFPNRNYDLTVTVPATGKVLLAQFEG
ncbi:uncharacterized protein LOC108671331 isoform X2 [Hyalella azteca]|uniref:Uncharacterized protein LOC108671331 isoform X2 n=1 Tax=Hyalella azteca TaxID=294128 RepID=A0A979FJC2_HYAAZ|nr:uncharacterized protein LOC108671331 isoform X2 [Hyalella azteca]